MSHPTEAHFTALDLKSIGDDGVFEGYASLFDAEDLGRDVIAPGAFRESLARKGAQGIRLLFQHRPEEPIGVWDTLKEDRRGLFARGVRRIAKADLWEISIVTFPMLPGARIRTVKHRPFAIAPPTGRELERWLTQDAGFTRSEARALLRHGLKGLSGMRDAAAGPFEHARLAERLGSVARLLRSSSQPNRTI